MLLMTTRTEKSTIAAALANQQYFGLFCTPDNHQTSFDLFDWWCADNGAFAYTMRGVPFDESAFWKMLYRLMPYRKTCKFVVVPDVPFDWNATLDKYYGWHKTIQNLGFPRAIAVQNGATVDNIPWNDCEAIFIGGSTEWKRSLAEIVTVGDDLPLFSGIPAKVVIHSEVPCIIEEARRRGKWVHMGRQANSWKQFRQARKWNVDSVDGSGEKRTEKWKQMAQWIFEVNQY